MRCLILALLLGSASLCSYAQNSIQLSGNIVDTTEKRALKMATIALLRASDSVLVKYVRTDEEGRFVLPVVKPGKYLLLISYPKYADYADVLDISASQDIGKINLITKAVLLQEVVVRGSAAIKMKGDTLAFVADSFKVQSGANVEDLLRRLPGLSVNSKGEITAQGQKVEKVLVDGDEFFGDDPTLATRNLQAAAIKEVQVFDKKSDQATFTGVDDGQSQKTINLKLKDEYKRGYFGKAKLGGGLPSRWENQVMVNAFKEKRKLSVYGIAANTNNNALGWSEEEQFGGNINNNVQVNDDGGMTIWSNGDEFGGTGGFYGEGLPTSATLGASFADKWNKNRSKVSGAYRFQHISTEANTFNSSQYILPDTQYLNNQRGLNQATRWRHKIQGSSEIFVDSTQSFTLNAGGSVGRNELYNRFVSEALSAKGIPVNESERNTKSNGSNGQFNASVLWKKKFAKKGRTFSLNLANTFSESESEGFLLNYNDFYVSGQFLKRDTTDQKKITSSQVNTISGRAAYTEPIGKKAVIEVSYGYSHANSNQQRLSYDNNQGKYDTLNRFFSNDFDFLNKVHRPGMGFSYSTKKFRYGFGADAGITRWEQLNKFNDSLRTYNFTNFFPKANLWYKLGTYSSIRINYNGSTQAPSLNQLQPVADNTDPLNIYVGNPDLDIAFNHRVELSYNFYQVLKDRGMWASLYVNPTSNAFGTRDFIDTLGRRVNQTVNVDGNYNLGGYMGYNMQLKKQALQVGVFFNPNLNRVTNFVNGLRNVSNNNSYRLDVNINKRKEKKYYADLGNELAYTTSTSSIRPDVDTRFWTWTNSFSINVEMKHGITFGTDYRYNWRQRTDVFPENNNAFIWNASLEKKVSKKQDMKVGVRVNDILNQNIGFRRNATANYITERSWDVIRRYWLITFNWNFHKGPQKSEEDFVF